MNWGGDFGTLSSPRGPHQFRGSQSSGILRCRVPKIAVRIKGAWKVTLGSEGDDILSHHG
jgi:hypothetical protein